MAANDGSERTEDATPRRRLEARRKGTVAKSNELLGSLVMAALIVVLPFVVTKIGTGAMEGLQQSIRRIPSELTLAGLGSHILEIAQPGLLALFVLTAVAMGAGLLINFGQVGFVISAESLKPSFEKINPLAGFKRLASSKTVFEALKTSAKTLLFGYLAYSIIAQNWPKLLGLAMLTPVAAASVIGSIIMSILIRIVMVWSVLAIIDYLFQRKQVDKQLKMTKDELRREMKEAEASPELKSMRQQRARKLAKGSLAEKIRIADVVITNPTHFAVVIQYDRSKMHAPMVVAKGQDYLALKIRELADDLRVPIIPNPPLARALYKSCEVGDFVPRDKFQAVAEILAFVYKAVKSAQHATKRAKAA